ncbi:hypothetical protein OG496_43730 [Streptomyces sp. NBC_00988]|uniref:hypothetical protein n=1 Tax=Streptomyces sp. NBC_00988 TaxID=2903704 RepID=UPI0038651046|nr:hypothetical protein OG496_43730 [Streptomyces sp. NBC_00988]
MRAFLGAYAEAGGHAVDTASGHRGGASGMILGERLRGGGTAVRPVLHGNAPDTLVRLLSRANTSAEPTS